jgi:hypothetical protein
MTAAGNRRSASEIGVIRLAPKASLLSLDGDQSVLARHHPDERIEQNFAQISLAHRLQNNTI